jgi:50S ribosomal protein L16 3-hydroxylase
VADFLFGSKITAEQFLKKYWQKKPYLFRNAFPKFVDPLTPDELAGIAMEEGVHARLVREKEGKKSWTLKKGPFPEDLLRTLPKKDWTILVSNLEQWIDEAAAILDHFPFIPHWRCDDLMASFAPVGGTVGPHIDSYDVFLIQGLGKRRWQIADNPKPEFIDGIDLKVLKSFKADEEWVVESGDMLYLPPGVAHYGVALENCMTYSVGFRAPTSRMLAGNLLNISDELLDDANVGESFYEDPDLKLQSCPGEISADAVERVRKLLAPILDNPEIWARWFGSYMSFPNPGQEAAEGPSKPVTTAIINTGLKKGKSIGRSDTVRSYYTRCGENIAVFAGGQEYIADLSWLPFLKLIFSSRSLAAESLVKPLAAGKADKERESLAEWLFNQSVLYFD